MSLQHVRSLLVWTILTASTVGPGTVAMCAKAGADSKAKLLWCVLVAATVAWVLQENAARLTLVSGMSLGSCGRARMRHGSLAAMRALLAAFVVFGGLAYEANNFAGTMSAVKLVVHNDACLYAINVLLGPLCTVLVATGSTQHISYLLSAVVALMIVCFSVAIAGSGIPVPLLPGLLPRIPAGSSELALGLVGTTAIPHNLLLGSAIARGASVREMRHGVALACMVARIRPRTHIFGFQPQLRGLDPKPCARWIPPFRSVPLGIHLAPHPDRRDARGLQRRRLSVGRRCGRAAECDGRGGRVGLRYR